MPVGARRGRAGKKGMTESQDRKDRRKAAAQWFAELQAEDLSPGTWAAFLAWEKNPQNAAAFREIEAAVGVIDRVPRTRPEATQPAKAGFRLNRRRPLTAWVAAAAACIGAVIAVPLLTPRGAPASDVYRTSIGERREIVLEDGSSILLNTDTELAVSYTDKAREIRLAHGEALFRVQKSTRPFLVDAEGTRTRALGTEFEVSADTGEVSVTLYEGSVLVAPVATGDSPLDHPVDGEAKVGIRLEPGDRVTVSAGAEPLLRQIDPDAAKSWRNGIVQFDDTSLEDAVREMNRYSTTEIRIGDPSIAMERISGSFPAGKQVAFAESLSLTLPLEIRQDGNEILILREGD